MAGLMNRKGVWYAVWKNGARVVQRSTGVLVKPDNMTAKKAEALARQQAEAMEQAAKGSAPMDKLTDAIRGAAEMSGLGGSMPSLREYLAAFPRTASAGSEVNRRRAFTLFLEYMGEKAERRLDLVTVSDCENFCKWALKKWSRGTVERHKNSLGNAFRRAVEIDDFMRKNPMRAVNLAGCAAQVCPERGADKQKRYPFTLAEIKKLITDLPAPWSDMVAVSWYTGGLRLSDVCLLRWDNINFDAGYICLTEKKTKKERYIPLCTALREKLNARHAVTGLDKYVFPDKAHFYLGGAAGYISTQFTALLRAFGMVAQKEEKTAGDRHKFAEKSFHSIRHAFVTWGRSNGGFTADVIRETVGHDSEAVEQGYFTCALDLKAKVLDAAADAVQGAPLAYSMKTA